MSAPVDPRRVTEAPPEVVAQGITGALSAGLAGRISSVIGHGSWIHGDFCPGRSDLDLLVVLTTDPDPALIAAVQAILGEVIAAYSEWSDRLEIGFVTPEAVQGVIDGDAAPRFVGRISSGEPLHLVVADRHRLLDWDAARHGTSISGAAPTVAVPAVPGQVVREVVREHLRNWPSWLAASEAVGFQAYAVMTVSRAVAYLDTGRRLSKRQGAAWLAARLPAWSPLIEWAVSWWYAEGADDDHPPASIAQFVHELARAAPEPITDGNDQSVG
jgi:hypothetical protein